MLTQKPASFCHASTDLASRKCCVHDDRIYGAQRVCSGSEWQRAPSPIGGRAERRERGGEVARCLVRPRGQGTQFWTLVVDIMKFALAITLCLMAATLCAATCPVSTCNKSDPALPTIWLNTTSMNTAIRGSSIVFYPRQPNGDIYELMSTSLSIDVLGEITHDSNGTCETQGMYVLSQYTKANRVPRYLAFKDACCTHDHIVDVIEGDISRERVVINVTYPAWPEFWFEFTVSTVNETLTIPRPPTPEIGEGYNIEFLYVPNTIEANPKRKARRGPVSLPQFI